MSIASDPTANSSQTICLIGGSGFIGRTLCADLLANGYQVRVLTRQPVAQILKRHPQMSAVELRRCQVHERESLNRELADVDVVINLAGILNQGRGRHQSFQAVHIDLPREIAKTCARLGITRLIQISALNASAARAPSHYLLSKGEGESAAKVNGGPNMRLTIFRPAVVFGEEDTLTNRFAGMIRMSPGILPLACPDSRFIPVYVGDVARAIVSTINDPASYGKRYELCGPQILSLRQLLDWLTHIMDRRRLIIGLPDGLSRLLARVMQHLPGKPFSPDNYRSLKANSLCEENGLEELGLTPTAMADIVPRYLGPGARRKRS